MVRNRELKMFKKCLPPCVTMNINLKHAVTRKNLPKNALLDLISKDDVTVYTEVYGGIRVGIIGHFLAFLCVFP